MNFTLHLKKVVLLDVLEVAVGADLQFVAGGIVGYDDAVLVHLQGQPR